VQDFDEYTARIRLGFDSAMAFFMKYKRPRTAAEWDKVSLSLGDYRDDFTRDLMTVVCDEIEREYRHEMTRRASL